MSTAEYPFTRTVCDCHECKTCCTRPGFAAPGDIDRIAAYLSVDRAIVLGMFECGRGWKLANAARNTVVQIPGMRPRSRDGWCIFRLDDGHCGIHPVSPFGCRMFDTHMSRSESDVRSLAAARAVIVDRQYIADWQALGGTAES